ncbi:MAG: hypothetical protein JSW51_06960 [Gemmatimonadota bacterium]|nr:MAG: hypothetical protein JSW51_06960 [Gemmatimonadota bacterium]
MPLTPSRWYLILSLPFVLWGTLAQPLDAQDSHQLGAGARIRLWSESIPERERIGRLILVNRDSITLNVTGDSMLSIVTLPLESIGRLDMSIGRNPLAFAGVVAAGAALGAIIVPALTTYPPECDLGYEDSSSCSTEVPDAVIGMAAGAILGIVTARLTIKERWLTVNMDLLIRDGTVEFHKELRATTSVSF